MSDAFRDSVEIVAPQLNAVVSRTPLTVVWRRGRDDARFTVTLLDSRGDVRWLTSTRDSVTTVPDSVTLSPDSTYLLYVDALRADGSSGRSSPRSFTIRR